MHNLPPCHPIRLLLFVLVLRWIPWRFDYALRLSILRFYRCDGGIFLFNQYMRLSFCL